MIKKGIYVLAVTVILLAGCEKETRQRYDFTIVTGRILDAVTGEPVAGAKVELVEFLVEDFSIKWHRVLLDTVTNANGEYYLHFDHIRRYSYSIGVEAEGHFAIHWWGGTYISHYPLAFTNHVNFDEGLIQEVNILLVPGGYLRYHVFNEQQVQNQVRIGNMDFSGFEVDTLTPAFHYPGGAKKEIQVYFGGYPPDSVRVDSIYIPRFDTAVYELTY